MKHTRTHVKSEFIIIEQQKNVKLHFGMELCLKRNKMQPEGSETAKKAQGGASPPWRKTENIYYAVSNIAA